MEKLYVVMRHFKSTGFCYAPGDLITEKDFWDPLKLRLGKVKVSEGSITVLQSDDAHLELKAQNLEARLRQPGLAELVKAYFQVPTIKTEEPAAVQEKAPIAEEPKSASVNKTQPGTPQALKREAVDVKVAATTVAKPKPTIAKPVQ